MAQQITKTELIELMDSMSIEEAREIIEKTRKENEGTVNFRFIFKTMGYEHSFGDFYKKK